MRFKRFAAVRCPKCGKWQVCEFRKDITESTFLCRFCKISRRVKRKNEIGLSVDCFYNLFEKEASAVVRKIKEKEANKEEAYFDSFRRTDLR